MVKFLDKGYPVRSMPGAVAERNVLASGFIPVYLVKVCKLSILKLSTNPFKKGFPKHFFCRMCTKVGYYGWINKNHLRDIGW